ncbi:hypothetical protein Ddye_004803 [Dipteronia dyeriana]|uniref:Uncharacterized protein n=1 Tax=Dipteronia dyeriana TaxID=168575 RepID=A0AAE0CP08_9ROSI|nr:hypothetical protein Ddye_004803 [Dipteronia dyeriana]
METRTGYPTIDRRTECGALHPTPGHADRVLKAVVDKVEEIAAEYHNTMDDLTVKASFGHFWILNQERQCSIIYRCSSIKEMLQIEMSILNFFFVKIFFYRTKKLGSRSTYVFSTRFRFNFLKTIRKQVR